MMTTGQLLAAIRNLRMRIRLEIDREKAQDDPNNPSSQIADILGVLTWIDNELEKMED